MRLLRKNFKLIGRCHPWCGNREYEVGRAAEKRAWHDDPIQDYIDEYDEPDWWSALYMGWGN